MGLNVIENIISWYVIVTIINNHKMASSEEDKLILSSENSVDVMTRAINDYNNVNSQFAISDSIKSDINNNNNRTKYINSTSCCEKSLKRVYGETEISLKANNKSLNIENNKVKKVNEKICPNVSKHRRSRIVPDRFLQFEKDGMQDGHRRRHQRSRRKREQIFASSNCTTVVAQQSGTAVLHCEVRDITENTVAWIRRSDRTLLSVGLIPFSADSRIYTAHRRHAKDWALHIRLAAAADEDYYECQVPTHPPVSLFYKLKVVEAYAVILGEEEKVVQEGSVLRLSCEVRAATEPPTHIFWYFGRRMLNYELDTVSVWVRGSLSELSVRAQTEHAGRYTCAPSNARPAHVNVHVQPGESPAAIQHGITGGCASNLQSAKVMLVLFVLWNVTHKLI